MTRALSARARLTTRFPYQISVCGALSCTAILLLAWAFVGGLQLAIQLHVVLHALRLFLAAIPSLAWFGWLSIRSLTRCRVA